MQVGYATVKDTKTRLAGFAALGFVLMNKSAFVVLCEVGKGGI